MIIDIKKFIKKTLELNKIKIKEKSSVKVISLLCDYINTLVFNIASIASIIALLNNSKKITKETIKIISDYINKKCSIHTTTAAYSSKGGTVLPPAYFGADESNRYSTSNPTSDILVVDWAAGEARPAMGGQSGGGKKSKVNVIKEYIEKVLAHYEITASSEMINELFKIFNKHFEILMKELKKCPDGITVKYINNIIKSNKNLEILK